MKCANLFNNLWLPVLAFLFVMSLVGMDFLFVPGSDQFRNGEMRYLTLALTPVIGRALWRMNPAWALFWCFSWLTWVLNDWPTYGFLDLMLIGGCLALGNEIRERLESSAVVTIIIVLAVGESVYGLFQRLGMDPFFTPDDPFFVKRAIGTLGHFTMLGPFVAMGAVAILARGFKERLHVPAMVLCLACIVATDSTMAVMGLLAGCGYLLFRKNQKAAVILAAVLIPSLILGAVFLQDVEFFSLTGRQVAWPAGVDAWLRSPFFGHGPGSWWGNLHAWKIPSGVGRWDQLHNDYLQLLVEQGLLGFSVTAIGLFLMFRKLQSAPPEIGGIAAVIVATAFGNFVMHVPCFGLIAGWLASYAHNHERTEL